MPKPRSKVELYEQIRRAGARDGLSIRELSRRFGVHRRDVRAALVSAVPPSRRQSSPRVAPALGAWKAIIDGWLEADRAAPRKQRHTARRVWERLVDEHGAAVAESTVRRYVGEARRREAFAVVEVMVPQRHPMGEEAEVDFGDISVYLDGLLTVVHLFVMRLSASGEAFRWAYLNEAQEVFLDGHVRAFEAFGGVPGTVRYDNLKAAVVRVLKGRDRAESERFVVLRSHYRFESFYCRPGIEGSHEKGGVEGEIGRFRRRWLVPVPHVASMAELNELLAAASAKDSGRHIYRRRESVAEHFSVEQDFLHALPAEPFPVALSLRPRVDHKARVSVRQVFYSVPVRYVAQRIDVRLGADTVEMLDGSRVVAHHPRGVVKGSEVLTLDHYLEVLAAKPGAMRNATALARARASGGFTDTHDRFWNQARRRLGERDGTKAFIEVLLAHRTMPADAVIFGMNAALAVASVDPAVVLIEARKATEGSTVAALPIGELARFDRPKPTLNRYDDLLEA
jgi:transposase